jgi:hypothetical protein
MQARQLNILFFSFFIILFSASFSLRANTISQPYGLFFVEVNQLEEKKEIFAAPTLKTDIHVDVQGLLSTTSVKQYFINPTNAIKKLQKGDAIRLQDRSRKWHSYTVEDFAILNVKTDTISAADTGEVLLIVTCYPFNALASGTPLRYVVSAEQTIN